MINISLNLSENQQSLLELLNDREIEFAQIRAVNKTVQWVKTHLRRGIAKRAGIKQNLLESRINMNKADYRQHRIRASWLWAGTQSIPVRRLSGAIRAQGTGIKVGKHYFEGGFDAMEGIVFERVGNKRLPIREVKLPIESEALDAFEDIRPQISSKLSKELESQIEFRLSKNKL